MINYQALKYIIFIAIILIVFIYGILGLYKD